MLWTNLKRVIRLGFVNFWRNGYVSLASVLIMTVTLLVISTLMFTKAVLVSTVEQIQNKVDINVYLVTSATEEEGEALKDKIATLSEVKEVTLSTREQELEKFRLRHENDELTLQALDEIGENPLGAAINIRAKDPSNYESIAQFLDSEKARSENSIIDKINYSKNKEAIDALTKMISASKKLGGSSAIFFIVISILISFNTIRLTIYMAREEISVMRLVGASTRYIRGPFVVNGLMYGLASTILALLILVPLTYWAGPYTEGLGSGVNVFTYYFANIFQIGVVLLLSGLAIGSVSSFLAVKKYLKV
ncbi:MAG TPA: permease-like cell division protein FtsX [Candidatus Paceibacterota bacterium]|nr:permease-like cell division protein FtsX [Candidatus Paceibacterota bacterium]